MEPDTVDRERPHPNSYWVIKGRFAAGEYPGDLDPIRAESKVRGLLDGGINQFVDLTEARELEPYAHLAMWQGRRIGRDVGWVRRPVRDVSVPDKPGQMTAILDAIDAALGGGRTVYVHCWGGVGRTGTVIGCWLVRHGSTGEEALRQVDELWRSMAKAHPNRDSPETSEQEDYVRDWSETSQWAR